MRVKIHKPMCLGMLALAVSIGAANAAQWDVTVTNLTHGNFFTPLLLTAHDQDTHLFQLGQVASAGIEAMSECGDLSVLLALPEVGPADDDTIVDPAGGLLAPGQSVDTTLITADANTNSLSIVAMILPTNDAFVGQGTQSIPAVAGTYTYYLNGYDAGTEGNDEVLNISGNPCAVDEVGMMPGAPGGDADTGATGVVVPGSDDSNTLVHIHRGVLGEADLTGDGRSDLVNSVHRWQNPVAKVVVTVTP